MEKIKQEYPNLVIKEALITTSEGMKLIQQYGIMSSSGVLVNGKLVFTGGSIEKQLREALDAANR